MYHERPHLYTTVEVNGIALLRGQVGGGCAITSGASRPSRRFQAERPPGLFVEDEAYIADIERLGFEAAYLKDVQLLHAGGRRCARERRETPVLAGLLDEGSPEECRQRPRISSFGP